jgi:hypothetical protein
MADETIKVSLVPAWKVIFPGLNGGSFTVDAGDTDTINWVIENAPAGAAISAISFSNSDTGVPWPGGNPNAPCWSAKDTNNLHQGQPPVHWPYTVTMTYEGQSYVSDPEITNKPPTGP